MSDIEQSKIIIFSEQQDESQFMSNGSTEGRLPIKVRIEEFKNNLKDFLQKMNTVINECPESIGRYHIDELELMAEFDSQGKVGLLGTGTSVGAKAGIKFILRRTSNE